MHDLITRTELRWQFAMELFSNLKSFTKFYSYLLLFLGIDIDNNIGAILKS
jgi:hypothetical protein